MQQDIMDNSIPEKIENLEILEFLSK